MDRYGIPEIFESEAKGQVKYVYEDIKYVLKVPVVNFIFRALANYPEFLSAAWEQVRPSMLTVNMEEAAARLRCPEITEHVSAINWKSDYDPQTLEQIQQTLFIFYYVNPKLLLIASAWAESLSNRPITPQPEAKGAISPGVLDGLDPIDLVHVPDASPQVKELLKDIAKTHQTMDIASDFLALARYPSFLHETWRHLKPYVQKTEYNVLQAKLKKRAVSLVHQTMPYPVTINRGDLEKIYSPDQIAGIMGVVSLFQNFLPGLVIDGEFIRRTLLTE